MTWKGLLFKFNKTSLADEDFCKIVRESLSQLSMHDVFSLIEVVSLKLHVLKRVVKGWEQGKMVACQKDLEEIEAKMVHINYFIRCHISFTGTN